MFSISDSGTIQLTRGDSANITVSITNGDIAYEIQPDDRITFTVRKTPTDPEIILQKDQVGTGDFHIAPADTSNLAFGKYKYDVQVTTAPGDVYTIIGPATFELLREVTW